MKHNNLISIVIPVYNVQGEYLEKCIKSIVEQDEFNDVEVIAVNDGSTLENCLKQLEILRKDNRVKIIDKPNGGVSSARNIGIEHSSGEYILFVDGDDFLEVDCLKKMKEVIKKEKFDIIFFKHSIFYSDTGNSQKNNDSFKITVDENKNQLVKESILCFDHNGYNIGTPWAKLIKMEIIEKNNLRYDENLPRSQDRVFMFDCLNYAENIKFYDYSGYIYNSNQYSVCNTYNKNLWFKLSNVYLAFEEKMKKYGYMEFFELLKCSQINFFYSSIKLDIFHKDNKISLLERISQANKIVKEELDFNVAIKNEKYFPKKRKILNKLLKYKLGIVVYLSFMIKN
ncbi:MAG: glycosyltransferase family 2 protein [Clostridia bacterium]